MPEPRVIRTIEVALELHDGFDALPAEKLTAAIEAVLARKIPHLMLRHELEQALLAPNES